MTFGDFRESLIDTYVNSLLYFFEKKQGFFRIGIFSKKQTFLKSITPCYVEYFRWDYIIGIKELSTETLPY